MSNRTHQPAASKSAASKDGKLSRAAVALTTRLKAIKKGELVPNDAAPLTTFGSASAEAAKSIRPSNVFIPKHDQFDIEDVNKFNSAAHKAGMKVLGLDRRADGTIKILVEVIKAREDPYLSKKPSLGFESVEDDEMYFPERRGPTEWWLPKDLNDAHTKFQVYLEGHSQSRPRFELPEPEQDGFDASHLMGGIIEAHKKSQQPKRKTPSENRKPKGKRLDLT